MSERFRNMTLCWGAGMCCVLLGFVSHLIPWLPLAVTLNVLGVIGFLGSVLVGLVLIVRAFLDRTK